MVRNRVLPFVVAAAAFAWAPADSSRADPEEGASRDLYVTAGAVHTGTGVVHRPGAVAIEGGKIVAVGSPESVAVPAGARTLDAGPHAHVIPGLVVAHSLHLSKGGDDPASVSPTVKAIDGYDFRADESRALAGGVTTVFVAPGAVRVVSGRAAVVKTAGSSREDRTLRADAGLVAGIGDAVNRPPAVLDPPSLPDAAAHPLLPHRAQLPVTRAGSLLLLRELFAGETEFGDAAADVVGGRAPLWLGADTGADLLAALAFAKESKLRPTLVGAAGAHEVVEELATAGLPVVLHWPGRPGRVNATASPDREKARTLARGNARRLHAAGVQFALCAPDETSLADLLFVAASATRAGLDPEAALTAVTAAPALILGVGDRVGSLETGKDGDLVVLSGEPAATRTFPVTTVVEGRVAWERTSTSAAVVVRAAEVHVGDGTVHAPGEVCIENGKIVEVGRSVGVPPGARFVDLPDGAVLPGLIDAFSHAGLAGESGSAGSNLTTATTASDALDPEDASLAMLAAEGVTTILAAPGGSGRVAGRASVVKTTDATPRTLTADAGLVVRLTRERDLRSAVSELDRTLKSAKKYRDGWDKYRKDKKEYDAWKTKRDAEAAKKAKEAKKKAKEKPAKDGAKAPGEKEKKTKDAKKKDAKKKDDEKTEPRKPSTDDALQGYASILDKKVPVFVRASTAEEIRAALKLLNGQWKLRVIVVGGDEARHVAPRLARTGSSVIASPTVLGAERGRPLNLLRELRLAELPASVGSDSYLGGAELLEVLAYGVRHGLSPRAAVQMATGDAARVLGVQDRVGLLAPGRDADVVLLTGLPFAAGSRIHSVYANGRRVKR